MALRQIFKFISTMQPTVKFSQTFHILQSIKFSKNRCGHASILTDITTKRNYATDETFNEVEQNDQEEIEVDDHTDKIQIRNLLYANSKEPIMLKLNDSASVQEVFDIIRENHKKMNHEHICQAVLVLWDLQKIFYNHNIYYETDSTSNSLLTANAILQNYMIQVNSHEDFETLIKLIENNYEKFSLDALTCTLLYLNRMGVKFKSKVIQLMIRRCEEEIENADLDNFPMTSLSRFIVTVFSQESLYPILVTVNCMPIILRKLDTCKTEEDFKLLTICLYKMKQLVTDDILSKYKKLVEYMLQVNLINRNNPRTIIKTIKFLNQPQWFEYHSDYTNQFIHLLKGSINQLSAPELVSLLKVFQVQKEPGDMLAELQDHALNILSKEEESLETKLDLLACLVSFSSPLNRPKFEVIARNYIDKNLTPISMSSLYKILYQNKFPAISLCNDFWKKYLKSIMDDPNNKLQNMLNLSQKYLHFCNNFGYRYRYTYFEKQVIDYFNIELKCNIFSLVSGNFTRIASFIIAFSDDYKYIEKILEQLLDMSLQFNSIDYLNISKGLQILSERKNIKYNNNNITNKILLLKSSLNDLTLKELENDPDLPDVNILLKSCVLRKENIEDESFKKILNYYVVTSNNLTSNIIKDIVYCLQVNNCLVPEIINKAVNYVIGKREIILGSTVDKVLHLCYYLGYYPENYEEFFSISSEIIQRDKDMFSGLVFLQSCLSLCFFQNLSEVLIKHIFSVHFMEKLDQELANCYAKPTYPSRVRDHLMQLNRAVCIDYPEFDIPWFHQKYIDEVKKKSKKSTKKDFFHKEVRSTLAELADETNKSVIEDEYTPYGYYLNFLLKSNNTNSKGTAIFLLDSKAYSDYTPNLKGYYQLRNRHLEILGYNIVQINYSEWKCLYTQENYKKYIRNKVYPVPI